MKSGKTVGKSNLSVEELEALLLQKEMQIRIIRDRLKLVSKFINEEIQKI